LATNHYSPLFAKFVLQCLHHRIRQEATKVRSVRLDLTK
jgi:hypothetical protein